MLSEVPGATTAGACDFLFSAEPVQTNLTTCTCDSFDRCFECQTEGFCTQVCGPGTIFSCGGGVLPPGGGGGVLPPGGGGGGGGTFPTISSVSSFSAQVGQTVTLTGNNLGNATQVWFGGVPAAFTLNVSTNQVTAAVPPNAPTAPVSVVTPGGTTQTAQNFVPTPVPTAAGNRQFDLGIAAQQQDEQFIEFLRQPFEARRRAYENRLAQVTNAPPLGRLFLPPPSSPPPLPYAGGAGVRDNNRRENIFQDRVNERLGLLRNYVSVTHFVPGIGLVTTIPDIFDGTRNAGVTDIKDEIDISFTRQLRAQAGVAMSLNTSFNLIISPRTRTISVPLQRAVRQTGGIIVEFDSVTGRFQNVQFDQSYPNRIKR